MLLSRYIALAVFIVLIIVISKGKGSFRQKFAKYGVAFVEGMVGGLIIDSIGVSAGYYYFPRQPLYSLSYFIIVIPCWGLFGMLTNYLWARLGREKFIRGLAITLPALFMFYEGTNLITGSWVYTVPWYWISLGWMPLVLTFVGCHRRRSVVGKVVEAEKKAHNVSTRYALQGLRVMLIIIMFPLMLASLVRLLTDLAKLREADISVRAYAKDLLLMG